MTLGPREVMRSEEIEGGPAGPANPISNPESLDCGCGQFPCPKLAKYATRKFFVTLLCCIGFIQAAGQEYFDLTSSTIARRFQFHLFHPNTTEWLTLANNGLLPFLLALPIAYWGDRIHRAAWTGGLVLIQSVGFLILVIPHIGTPATKVIEETVNITTHLSLYAEDNPELCSKSGLARLTNVETEPPYVTLGILIISQMVSCMANIAFFALGISYLDDNTRKRHVPIPLGLILGLRILGILFGYILAWGCLRVDAEDLSETVQSYREQNGAWWLGWPILAILLAIPGLLMSWFPRRLPSEAVEEAAASILDPSAAGAGRASPLSESTLSESAKNIGDTGYFPSMLRLLKNKILIFNIFSSVFCILALVNFANNEDIILESRFYAPRPSGIQFGFGDPLTSRIISRLSRPIIIAAIIIASGVIISKVRPRAKWLVSYNIAAGTIAAVLIFYLAFVTCNKTPIVGSNSSGSRVSSLLRYCNKDCRCSRDANFQPVCDSSGSLVFYTPCHAGCTAIKNTDGGPITFTGCSCIKEISGLLGNEAVPGPCVSTKCQFGWIVFEVSTILAYALISSCAVSTFLIGLRSIYVQDKALAIGLWISLTSVFVYILGKMLYWQIANSTCIYRGNSPSLCHLYDSVDLGAYLAYMTTLFLLIGVFFELFIFFICRRLRIYREIEVDSTDVIVVDEAEPTVTSGPASEESSAFVTELAAATAARNTNESETSLSLDDITKSNGPLKFGPVGPGEPRTTTQLSSKSIDKATRSSYTDDTGDETPDDDDDGANKNKRAPISLMTISYRRLEMDTDAETSDSSTDRSRSRRLQQSVIALGNASGSVAGFSKTNDIEFKKWKNRSYAGDFNEVGIPIVDYPLALQSIHSKSFGSIVVPPKLRYPEVNYHKQQQQEQEQQEQHEKGNDDNLTRAVSPVGHTSSGFGSLASDLHRITSGSATPTQAPEYSGSETGSSSIKLTNDTQTKSTRRKNFTGYSTAL